MPFFFSSRPDNKSPDATDNQAPDASVDRSILRPTSSATAPRTTFLLTSLDQCSPQFLTELRQYLESSFSADDDGDASSRIDRGPPTRPATGNFKDDNDYNDEQANAQGPPQGPNTLTRGVSHEETTPPRGSDGDSPPGPPDNRQLRAPTAANPNHRMDCLKVFPSVGTMVQRNYNMAAFVVFQSQPDHANYVGIATNLLKEQSSISKEQEQVTSTSNKEKNSKLRNSLKSRVSPLYQQLVETYGHALLLPPLVYPQALVDPSVLRLHPVDKFGIESILNPGKSRDLKGYLYSCQVILPESAINLEFRFVAFLTFGSQDEAAHYCQNCLQLFETYQAAVSGLTDRQRLIASLREQYSPEYESFCKLFGSFRIPPWAYHIQTIVDHDTAMPFNTIYDDPDSRSSKQPTGPRQKRQKVRHS